MINMPARRSGSVGGNGRMYEPWLGRFLSPDNFVQAADYSQNLNRYSYALNNPLVFIDPDGEWVQIVVGAVIGTAVGYISGSAAGLTGTDLLYYTLASAAIGAISGGIGSAVSTSVSIGGSAFISGAVSGAAGGAAAGFVAGAGTAALNNTVIGRNENILTKGLIGAGIGATTGFLLGGVSGGIESRKTGGKFFAGKTGGSNRAIYIYQDENGTQYSFPKDNFDALEAKIKAGTARRWEKRLYERVYNRVTMSLGKYTANDHVYSKDITPYYFKENIDVYYSGDFSSRNQQFQINVNNGEQLITISPESYKWQSIQIDNVQTINLSVIGPPFNANVAYNDPLSIVIVVPDLDVRVVGYRFW